MIFIIAIAYSASTDWIMAAVMVAVYIIYKKTQKQQVSHAQPQVPKPKTLERAYIVNIETEGDAYPGLIKMSPEGGGSATRKKVDKTTGKLIGGLLKWLKKVAK